MTAQFVRDEAYALSPKAKSGRLSIDHVVAEAERDEGNPKAFDHVEMPRHPIYLTPERPSDIAKHVRVLASESLEPGTGQRMKRFARSMVSRVMTYPVSVAALGGPDVVEEEIKTSLAGKTVDRPEGRRLVAWMAAAMRWSMKDLGDRGSFVFHGDEAHPHIHHIVPLRRRPKDPKVADLWFWKPAAAEARVREECREAGVERQGKDMIAAGKAARRDIMDSYQEAVGGRFGHALLTDDPRKRRRRRDHLLLRDAERGLASTKAALAEREAELAETRAALEREKAENAKLRDKLGAVLERARFWFSALRGEPSAVREITEAPTLSQGKIDSALGVSQADVQRRRVAAV